MNADECLLTRMQEMSLDYHFTVEQEVGSATHAFFGFNGNSFNFFLSTIPNMLLTLPTSCVTLHSSTWS